MLTHCDIARSLITCSRMHQQAGEEVQMDEFARNLAVQIPIQIAVGRNNKFLCLWNGEDNQAKYKLFVLFFLFFCSFL